MSARDFWILSYGCTSAAGRSSSELWTTLMTGRVPQSVRWPETESAAPGVQEIGFARRTLNGHLFSSWTEALENLSPTAQKRVSDSSAIGVIFASTKGAIDDLVWEKSPDLSRDSLAPVLDDFLVAANVRPERRTCVSNACTSGLSALFLAQHWLENCGLTDVIILSADVAGPFVQKGFATLKVLTVDQTRPFSGERSGFKIGDASACLILSRVQESGAVRLAGVSIDGEGHAVTRPSQSGESLEAACRRLPITDRPPDLVIAHGTSTQINDATEDRVYARLFSAAARAPLITATKWATGHTLGASSALDLIAACEVLKHNQAFAIATTTKADATFKNQYAVAGGGLPEKSISRVMVCSLGFGGIHAAALLENPAR